jgi:two-component system LytT family sensor kinase
MLNFIKNRIVILIHLFCWLILAAGLLLSHPPDWGNGVPPIFWFKQLLLLLLLVSLFYLNLYLLVPRYLVQKEIRGYAIRVIPAVLIAVLINSLINSYFHLNSDIIVYDPGHRPHTFPGYQQNTWNLIAFVMITMVIGLGITISFIQKWNEEVLLRQSLQQEKVSSELAMLKAQINPHFFFNTLNNIYSYTLTDGDIARDAITNLSQMMRYVLYDTTAEKTLLSREIEFVEEYIALMKLRISEKTKVTFVVSEPVTDLMIAPMLLLPFIENAFKHGTSGLSEGYIDITITQAQKTVQLVVTNTIYPKAGKVNQESSGIGIANTTKRLALLYPGKYELSTGKINETAYSAKLFIWV